jgi:hypothetical protein
MHPLHLMGGMIPDIIEEQQGAQPIQMGHIVGTPLTKCPIDTTMCKLIPIPAVYIVEIPTRWRIEHAEMKMNDISIQIIPMHLLVSIEELLIPRDLTPMHQNLIIIEGQTACTRQTPQPHHLATYLAVLIPERRHKYNTIP